MMKNRRWSFIPRRCPYCLRWIGTLRGMRDHLLQKHGIVLEK
jgi:hypothetical protein